MSGLPFELLLAMRYLRPKRTFVSVITLISVLGVSLGVAVLIIVISVMTGFDHHLREKILGFNPHLRILPLAAVTLTQREWDAVGEHSSSHIPSAKRATTFGMILEPLDEDDRNFMKRSLPGPVRLLYPLMIQRPWTKYASTLRTGT